MHLAESESCWERGEAQASRTCLITDRFIHHVHFANYIAWYWLRGRILILLHTTKNTRILTKRRRCTFKLRTQRMCYWKIYIYSILRVVIPPKNSLRPIHPNQEVQKYSPSPEDTRPDNANPNATRCQPPFLLCCQFSIC